MHMASRGDIKIISDIPWKYTKIICYKFACHKKTSKNCDLPKITELVVNISTYIACIHGIESSRWQLKIKSCGKKSYLTLAGKAKTSIVCNDLVTKQTTFMVDSIIFVPNDSITIRVYCMCSLHTCKLFVFLS